jgi:hypothetical protein
MAVETVEVRSASGLDSNGDPIAPGSAVTLTPLEVAPGNTARVLGDDGALDVAEFTLYFPLRVRVNGGYTPTDTVVRDDYAVIVRDRNCFARVQKWASGGRGGVVVLCKSATGGRG